MVATVRGLAVTLVAGVVLGATSAWHQAAGGAGTTGRLLPVVALAVVVVAGLVAALLDGAR